MPACLSFARSPFAFATAPICCGSTPNEPQGQGAFCQVQSQSTTAGVYYVQCPKVGSVYSDGSRVPHVDFAVQPPWLWNLLAGGRRRGPTQHSLRRCAKLGACRGSFHAWTIVAKSLASARLVVRMSQVRAELCAARRPFWRLPIVGAWVALPAKTRWRSPFLV